MMQKKFAEQIRQMDEITAESRRANPRPHELNTGFLRPRDVDKLRALVEAGANERKLDHLIRGYPNLLSALLYFMSTGNKGGQVLPQQTVRPHVQNVKDGLIPDYLISGKSSDGTSWWVIEMKGANKTIFAGSGRNLRLSGVANWGLLQLWRYLAFCAKHQSSLRDSLELKDFREPRGLLIIGRELEFEESEERQAMKRMLNQQFRGVAVRTWDAFLRDLDHKLRYHGFRNSKAASDGK